MVVLNGIKQKFMFHYSKISIILPKKSRKKNLKGKNLQMMKMKKLMDKLERKSEVMVNKVVKKNNKDYFNDLVFKVIFF